MGVYCDGRSHTIGAMSVVEDIIMAQMTKLQLLTTSVQYFWQ